MSYRQDKLDSCEKNYVFPCFIYKSLFIYPNCYEFVLYAYNAQVNLNYNNMHNKYNEDIGSRNCSELRYFIFYFIELGNCIISIILSSLRNQSNKVYSIAKRILLIT